MYCNNCGAKITDDSNYCKKCGNKINAIKVQKKRKPNKKVNKPIVYCLCFVMMIANIYSFYSIFLAFNKEFSFSTLFNRLEGTWSSGNDAIMLVIGKDEIRISDSSGAFDMGAFTYSKIDKDTLRIKPTSEALESGGLVGTILNKTSIDLDYKVMGDYLTISVGENSMTLQRKK